MFSFGHWRNSPLNLRRPPGVDLFSGVLLLWSEGDLLRFTRSKDNRVIYCFALTWPGRTLEIRSLEPRQIRSVEMLGFAKQLEYLRDPTRGLVVTIPDEIQQPLNRPCDYCWGFKITYSG